MGSGEESGLAHRRLADEYERHPEVSEAIIRWAAINGMLHRIARDRPRPTSNSAALHLALTWPDQHLNNHSVMSTQSRGNPSSPGTPVERSRSALGSRGWRATGMFVTTCVATAGDRRCWSSIFLAGLWTGCGAPGFGAVTTVLLVSRAAIQKVETVQSPIG